MERGQPVATISSLAHPQARGGSANHLLKYHANGRGSHYERYSTRQAFPLCVLGRLLSATGDRQCERAHNTPIWDIPKSIRFAPAPKKHAAAPCTAAVEYCHWSLDHEHYKGLASHMRFPPERAVRPRFKIPVCWDSLSVKSTSVKRYAAVDIRKLACLTRLPTLQDRSLSGVDNHLYQGQSSVWYRFMCPWITGQVFNRTTAFTIISSDCRLIEAWCFELIKHVFDFQLNNLCTIVLELLYLYLSIDTMHSWQLASFEKENGSRPLALQLRCFSRQSQPYTASSSQQLMSRASYFLATAHHHTIYYTDCNFF